jgi:hypothetical protein
MSFIHITRLFYSEICLISKDCAVEEMNSLIYSWYDKLIGFRMLFLVDNYQHGINN